jgi:hypothetical protein
MDKIENAYSRCVLRLRPSQKYTRIKEVHYNAEYYRCIKISNDDDEDINARKLYQYFS